MAKVGEIAAARGVSRAQVALAWMLTKPVITAPIVGATKMQHLEDALASLDVKLTADEIAALEAAYTPTLSLGINSAPRPPEPPHVYLFCAPQRNSDRGAIPSKMGPKRL